MMRLPDITLLADTQDGCGEGPIWDPLTKKLYWVDILSERIHDFDWPSGSLDTRTAGGPCSAVTLVDGGGLVIAGAKGIWLDANGERIAIAQTCNGEALAINDCIADPKGRLLAGSTFFDSTDNYSHGSLYAIERDGRVRILDTGFRLANGMGFSPDERTLYFTDSAERVIYAYDYDSTNGVARDRRVLVQLSVREGLPDGLTVDAEGFVWSAQWFGGCLCRYDPDGTLERRVTLPAKQTSSLAFGGTDLTDIFVTSAATPDALPLAPATYEQMGNIGGQLYHLNLGIPGRPEYRCRFIHRA